MQAQHSFLDSCKALVMILAVAILLPMTVHTGLKTFNPRPEYSQIVTAKNTQLHDQQHETYNSQRARYEKTYFYVSLACGLAAILMALLFRLPIIDSGLILGGCFTLVMGYLDYWSDLPQQIRFFSVLAALVILLIFIYRKHIR
ncbi:MAG: hypothetical protein DHS20C10_01630 [marine bacterium B5-7]|nr:MAG: hypothetical protein DHS20C10_01630 [marine bacterium B5-7]